MKKLLLVLVAVMILSGCTVSQGDVIYGSYTWYESELAEIEQAYQNGDVSEEEYKQLMDVTERLHIKWKATKGARGRI